MSYSASPSRPSNGTTRKNNGYSESFERDLVEDANDTIGMPAAESTALALIDAAEQAAPATAITESSTSSWAEAAEVVPSQPESSSSRVKL